MISRNHFRRMMLRALKVADYIFIQKIISRINANTLTTYLIVSMVVGFGLMQAAFLFQPLFIVGLILMPSGIIVTFLAHMTDWATKKVHRVRPFGGSQISATLYWKICDRLEQRGITNAKRYFQEHPEHSNALFHLIVDMYSARPKEWDEIVSLVYLDDENPEATGEAITRFIKERGDMPSEELQALLAIKSTTASPLTDGVL